MKRLILLLSVFATASAVGADAILGQVPRSGCPDTESTTNVPFAFGSFGVRDFRFELVFVATPSNNVQLAFGRDADGDGVLALGEADMAFAWDCGEWRIVDGASGACFAAPAATTNAAKRLEWNLRMQRMRLKHLDVTENGVPVFQKRSDAPEPWFYSPEWNLLRLTVRGVDAAGEGARVGLDMTGCSISLR